MENVLFTNVDATASPFAHLAQGGVSFEFLSEDPSTSLKGPPLKRCSVYEVLEGQVPYRWQEGGLFASWDRVPLPSIQRATRSASVWWELRQGKAIVTIPNAGPPRFGVHLVLHVPVGQTVNAAAQVKVAIDASVLALSCSDGTCSDKGLEIFADAAGQPMAAVKQLLCDRSRAVFGACRAVTSSGQADPPDDGCYQGSLLIERDGREWQLSGRVVSLSPPEP